jgi:glycerophosphoryl diester phosphodiesterase
VPTLAEALAACAGRTVDVEIKGSPVEPGHDPGERLAAEVADLVSAVLAGPGAPAHVFVSSFWPATLEAVHERRPELPVGLLVAPALPAGEMVGLAAGLGASMLLPFRDQVDGALVDACHDRHLAVWTWTVNEAEDLRRAAAAGVDGVITDRVALALEVLRGAARR